MRGRVSDGPYHATPVAIGDARVGGTVSRVEVCRHGAFKVGGLVLGYTGWQDCSLSDGKCLTSLHAEDPDSSRRSVPISPCTRRWMASRRSTQECRRGQADRCHAPCVLRHARAPGGQSLVKGKNVTGFTFTKEEAAGLIKVAPFLGADMLKESGGRLSEAADWQPHVLVDGLLIAGQNPASSEPAAKALLAELRASSVNP
jgi:hypothetical protein